MNLHNLKSIYFAPRKKGQESLMLALRWPFAFKIFKADERPTNVHFLAQKFSNCNRSLIQKQC